VRYFFLETRRSIKICEHLYETFSLDDLKTFIEWPKIASLLLGNRYFLELSALSFIYRKLSLA